MRLMVRYPHSLDPRYRARVGKHAIDVDASHDFTSDRLSPPIPDFNPATRQRNPHQISQFTGLKQEYHLSSEGFETHWKRNSGTNVNGYFIPPHYERFTRHFPSVPHLPNPTPHHARSQTQARHYCPKPAFCGASASPTETASSDLGVGEAWVLQSIWICWIYWSRTAC